MTPALEGDPVPIVSLDGGGSERHQTPVHCPDSLVCIVLNYIILVKTDDRVVYEDPPRR